MSRLNRRVLRLEDWLARRQLPADPRAWRIDDFQVWWDSLSTGEQAALEAQAERELEEWQNE
jgi:hypothetical protein